MAQLYYLMGFFGNEPRASGPAEVVDFNRDLHLTLLPGFAMEPWQEASFGYELEQIASRYRPLSLRCVELTQVGTAQLMPAALVRANRPDELLLLHKELVASLYRHGGKFFQPDFTGDSFTPHITYWDGAGELELRHLTLVAHRGGFLKRVENVASYTLGASPTFV